MVSGLVSLPLGVHVISHVVREHPDAQKVVDILYKRTVSNLYLQGSIIKHISFISDTYKGQNKRAREDTGTYGYVHVSATIVS